MGCFSWKFANESNKKRLRIGRPAYLYCPNGVVVYESYYEGYGEFDGLDVYDLVADWNREYLSKHPEFTISRHGGPATLPPAKRIDEYPWYAAYADLSKSREEVIAAWIAAEKTTGNETPYAEWRGIGIEIACYDDWNAALPFPIKICSNPHARKSYAELPPSESDPDQGF